MITATQNGIINIMYESEKIADRRNELNRLFDGKRRRRQHVSKESIILAFQELHLKERYLRVPDNLFTPAKLRELLKGRI